MSLRPSLRTSLLAALLTAGAAGTPLLVAGCSDSGSSTTGVTTGTATTLAKASGDQQSTTTGTAAASALVVKVTDASGNAVSGVAVTWAITSGGGSLSATSATTDANGQASTTYTAGTTVGTSIITASVSGLTSVAFNATVTASSTTADCGTVTGTTAKAVCLANAFKATLSTAQQASVQTTLSSTYWVKWSNLPCGSSCRNGLQFSSLSSTQQAAALALAQAALSTQGYNTFAGIRAADDYLNANGGGSGYGSGIYFIAFLGTPSTTGRWMLQLGGHHYAYNLDFNGGNAATPVTATPMFVGVEPQTFTSGGTTYAPVNARRDAMYAILGSLSTSQLASAKLSSSFSDVLLGPGQDNAFPTSQGLQGSQLTSAQLALVKTAIEQWVNDLPTAEAAALLAQYEDATALSNTYVAWSGASTPTVQGSYVRVDGPRVWIEFVCQNGVVFPSQIHYHTIWRDRTSDYGGSLSSLRAAGSANALERWLAAPHYTTPSGPLAVSRSYASR